MIHSNLLDCRTPNVPIVPFFRVKFTPGSWGKKGSYHKLEKEQVEGMLCAQIRCIL